MVTLTVFTDMNVLPCPPKYPPPAVAGEQLPRPTTDLVDDRDGARINRLRWMGGWRVAVRRQRDVGAMARKSVLLSLAIVLSGCLPTQAEDRNIAYEAQYQLVGFLRRAI